MQPWKTRNVLDGNPIGLPAEVATKLIPDLDQHLAALFVLFHQYLKQHWLVEGPQYRDLHLFLGETYTAILKQADLVAERITALGGIPTSHPVEQATMAYIAHGPEGQYRIRAMLELDRRHEGRIAQELRQTIRLARDLGDPGTEHLLMQILLEVENRVHHLDNFLGADSLEMDQGQ
jgi:DNA-binding ferritin-like protein